MQNESFVEGLRFLQRNRAFLGREFLTWLWFRTESQKHNIEIPGHGKFKLYLDDKLVLSATSGSVFESALKGGTPGHADEAHLALKNGKMVHEAKFILQDGKRQWSWSMKSDDLSLRAVRLPPVVDPEPGAFIAQRMMFTQTLIDVVDTLFKKYMNLRLSNQFSNETQAMTNWLDSKAAALA